jgi:hypothetical protein
VSGTVRMQRRHPDPANGGEVLQGCEAHLAEPVTGLQPTAMRNRCSATVSVVRGTAHHLKHCVVLVRAVAKQGE